VLVGWSFAKRIIKMQGGAYFLVGVIAHECAHILQLQMSLCESLLCSGRVVKVELHADFLAGVILSKSKASLSTLDESVLVDQWRNIGDTEYGDFNHHGTAEQRLASFRQGYTAGAGADSISDLAQLSAIALQKLRCEEFRRTGSILE
jgi:predicted metalloprotease